MLIKEDGKGKSFDILNLSHLKGLFAGDPNIVGRDGSVPLMVCLVPLINKDPLHHFTHSMKVSQIVYIYRLVTVASSYCNDLSLLLSRRRFERV